MENLKKSLCCDSEVKDYSYEHARAVPLHNYKCALCGKPCDFVEIDPPIKEELFQLTSEAQIALRAFTRYSDAFIHKQRTMSKWRTANIRPLALECVKNE